MMNLLYAYEQESQRCDHKPETIVPDSEFIQSRCDPPGEQAKPLPIQVRYTFTRKSSYLASG